MATEAQNNANRENAKRSTGPNTAGGKETSSRNAVRHGILAAVIPAETPGFQETLLGLYASLNPMDEPQRLLVDQIAISMVRLQRVLAAEQQFLEAEATKASGDNRKSAGITAYLLSETASLSLRYEAMLNRLIQRKQRKKSRSMRLPNNPIRNWRGTSRTASMPISCHWWRKF